MEEAVVSRHGHGNKESKRRKNAMDASKENTANELKEMMVFKNRI